LADSAEAEAYCYGSGVVEEEEEPENPYVDPDYSPGQARLNGDMSSYVGSVAAITEATEQH
jgi:hypothetical protein